jgi:exonuclease III
MYQGKKLSLYGLHLKSGIPLFLPDNNGGDEVGQSQAKARALLQKTGEILALRSFATEEIKSGKEVCFLGDFNESTSSLLFGILKESKDEKFYLSDVMSGKSFDKTTHIHKGDRQILDTLLVSPLLRTQIKEVEVRNEGLLDMSELPLDNMEIGSDHAPVVVTFL